MHHTRTRTNRVRHATSSARPRTTVLGVGYAHARKSRGTRAENENVPTAVYCLYDVDENLLYVGSSNSPGSRQRDHEKEKHWFPRVAKTTYAWFGTLSEAQTEEARLIDELRPRHNRNRGVRKRYNSRHVPSPCTARDLDVAHATEDAPYLLPRERVLVTLTEASEPLSFEEIKRRTSGKTQSLREAIGEVLVRGEAVAVTGQNGNRVVLAGREHLLERPVAKQSAGTMRERILSALRDIDKPIALSGVVKRTRGKTADIMMETKVLLAEGVLTETAGPRRARLVSIAQ